MFHTTSCTVSIDSWHSQKLDLQKVSTSFMQLNELGPRTLKACSIFKDSSDLHDHLHCPFNFVLSGQEGKDITGWLRLVQLHDRIHCRFDVVGYWAVIK